MALSDSRHDQCVFLFAFNQALERNCTTAVLILYIDPAILKKKGFRVFFNASY